MGRFLRKWAVRAEKVKRYFAHSKIPKDYAPVHVGNVLFLRRNLQKSVMDPSNWRAGVAIGESRRVREGQIIREIKRETLEIERRLAQLAQNDFELRKYLKSKKYLYIDDDGLIKLTNFLGIPGTNKPRVRISKV